MSPIPDLVIGIDSSTTATKAIAWTRDGEIAADVQRISPRCEGVHVARHSGRNRLPHGTGPARQMLRGAAAGMQEASARVDMTATFG